MSPESKEIIEEAINFYKQFGNGHVSNPNILDRFKKKCDDALAEFQETIKPIKPIKTIQHVIKCNCGFETTDALIWREHYDLCQLSKIKAK